MQNASDHPVRGSGNSLSRRTQRFRPPGGSLREQREGEISPVPLRGIFQKVYFSDSCRKRASGVLFWKNFAPVICPACGPMPVLEGLPQVGWFSRLNASARNCRYCSRQVMKFLNRDIFTAL